MSNRAIVNLISTQRIDFKIKVGCAEAQSASVENALITHNPPQENQTD